MSRRLVAGGLGFVLAAAFVLGGPLACRDQAAARPPPPQRSNVEFVERVVGGAASDAEMPMIVAIHGLGDRPESFIRLMEDFDRAARVIAVRGIIPYREGRAWFAIRFRDNEPEALAAALAKAADRVAATIRDLQERRPTRGRPIVLGFSQGGMMSFALAVRHPDLFAAALPISGWLPPALLPRVDVTAPIPIRTLHGVNDRIVPFAPTASVAKQLERVGQPVELIPFPGVGHRITPPMKARLFSELRELL